MDNNSYQTPASSSPNQPNDSFAAAFASSLEYTPEKQPSSKKKLFIFIGLCILLVGGGTWAILAADYLSRPACLTANDYFSLTGEKADSNLSSADAFDIYVVDYQPDGVQYLDKTKATTQSYIKKLGAFFNEHKDKSLSITVATTYQQRSDYNLEKNRAKALKADLLKAGIPEQSIIAIEPNYVATESQNDPTMSLTSIVTRGSSNCR